MVANGVDNAAALQGLQPPPDVVICNVDLRGENGLSVAAWARMATGAGVILLAEGERREERILGLSLGLDHCLSLPIDLRELELFVRNLGQRVAASARRPVWGAVEPVARPAEPVLPSGTTWRFDVSRWQLIAPEGEAIALSLAEHLILRSLITHAGDVVSRDKLLTALRGRSVSLYSRNLDMIVSRLRRKVERACGERLPVVSARGIGYVFTGRCELRDESTAAPRHVERSYPMAQSSMPAVAHG